MVNSLPEMVDYWHVCSKTPPAEIEHHNYYDDLLERLVFGRIVIFVTLKTC